MWPILKADLEGVQSESGVELQQVVAWYAKKRTPEVVPRKCKIIAMQGHAVPPREVTHEVDNEGSRRPGKRGRSSSTAGRSTHSTKRTAHSTSLTEADIPRIADAIIQAISTRSCENPHGDGNPDSADTENDTDDFTPSDTMESGKMYYNQ